MTEVIQMHEREVRAFPRDRFVSSAGQSLVFPSVRDLSAFEIKDTAEGVNLRVLGLIGYLPVTPTVALNLRPKFPTENLWLMLEEADETFEAILPTARHYMRVGQEAPHLLLARAFAHYVREIVTSGLARSYSPERAEGYFKPKISFSATISRSLPRGDPVRTVSDVFNFTTNMRPNGLLKTACRHFLAIMPRTDDWKADRQYLADTLASLSRVAECDITAADLTADVGVPARMRAQYAGALMAYGIYRGLTKVGFEYTPGGTRLPSFLFCLDDIFEGFIRNTLRNGLRGLFSVADGNRPKNQRPLFEDNRTYPVKPDMIFKEVNRTAAIGEVKYKPKIDEGDRYQLLSHTLAHGAPLGIWFSPAATPEAEGLQYVGNFAGKAKFVHYRIDLSSNLKSSAAAMVRAIGEIIAT